MNSIFISFIFLFINFSIKVGDSHIGIVPDFVGFYYLMKGIGELKKDDSKKPKGEQLARIMMVYSGIMYVMDLFGISDKIGIFMLIPAIIKFIASFWMCNEILRFVKDVETREKVDYHTEQLPLAYQALLIGCFGSLLMSYIGFSIWWTLLVNAIPYAGFMMLFYRTKECMLASE